MKNRRLFWNIVDQIEEQIDSGLYTPGTRLPPERVLAEKFNVSRPTIREAIIALEVRGKVEVKTSSGVYILERADAKNNDTEISAFELTQARALVEGEAAALAASNITEDELAQLANTLERMEQPEEAEAADEEFHRIIANATHNNALATSIENFWLLRQTRKNIVADYANVCSSSDAQRMQEHKDIYKALEAGDPERARAAMHAHFHRLINALFDASEAQMMEEIKRKTNESRGLYSLNHLVQ